MNETKTFSIFDCKAEIFTLPYYSQNAETAKREFAIAINGQGMMSRYPEDFTLFEMGSFKFEGGITRVHAAPIAICKGIEIVENPTAPTAPEFGGGTYNFVDTDGNKQSIPRANGER